MGFHSTRIAIVGWGHVGTSCAFALAQSRLCREIVFIDEAQDRVRGEAMDLQQSVPLGVPVKIFAGDYKDAAASSIVVLTVGSPVKFTHSRLDMLAANIAILRACLARLMAEQFAGVLLLATNPVDILTFVAQRESGLPIHQVIGSGTLLDSERLRFILGQSLNVDARSVHAVVIGEHGDSAVAVWSAVEIGGSPLAAFPGPAALPSQNEILARVRRAGLEVTTLKGNTCFAIAVCVTRIREAILRDERSVLPVSTLMTGQHGLHDVCLGTPCVIGKSGVETVDDLRLNAAEQKALEASAAIVRSACAGVHEA